MDIPVMLYKQSQFVQQPFWYDSWFILGILANMMSDAALSLLRFSKYAS